MEYWSIGVMEYWDCKKTSFGDSGLEDMFFGMITITNQLFQYPSTPLLHHSMWNIFWAEPTISDLSLSTIFLEGI
jgi:hypothetical protein